MSIVKEKPQLDPVLKAQPGAGGQEIEQKDRHDNVFKIYSCLKEFETANFETPNPEMKFSIQSGTSIQPDAYLPAIYLPAIYLPATHLIPSNPSSLSGKICRVEESGFNFLQPAERSHLNFNQLTENNSIVTGRATELCACPEAPEARN